MYVFIRPSIIKPRFDGIPDEYTQLKIDYAKYQLIKTDIFFKEKDPIQRWFFSPTHESMQKRTADARVFKFPIVDNFTDGKNQPKSVDIKRDPHFKVSESLQQTQPKLKKTARTLGVTKEKGSEKEEENFFGGADGARTRDLPRDRRTL